ncbi:MAG TPA: YggS family pyridoxal phosphate-dependent enzyme [Gemmatimonadales bacterium]|nr:YggS family pyridoxal phosphate-dependent enzyme [Gemmatimonadales bacterium]
MSFTGLSDRLSQIRAEIARRQVAGGWTHPVTVLAVTKGFGPDAVKAALDAGLTGVGENRVQEALEKMEHPECRGAEWHLIGHLQRNKAKFVPGKFVSVQSVDSVELAEELDRRASAQKAKLSVLVQVNVAGESQKSGCEPAEVPGLVRRLTQLESVTVDGLMAMAPLTDDEAIQRRAFRGLREIRDRLKEDGIWLQTLSMGMSGDFGTAVQEGATLIRLGTALFGARTT